MQLRFYSGFTTTTTNTITTTTEATITITLDVWVWMVPDCMNGVWLYEWVQVWYGMVWYGMHVQIQQPW